MSGQELQQTQRLTTSLSLTPQMRQSLQFLAANALEMRAQLRGAMERNPLLEETPPPEPAPDAADDFDDEPLAGDAAHEAQKRHNFLMETLAAPETPLRDRLLEQTLFLDLGAREKAALAYLVDNLDDAGFLPESDAELARAGNFSPETVRAARDVLRTLDPAGIGADDLRDCLRLQLARAGAGDSLAGRILERHFDKLPQRKVREIARAEGATPEAVERALDAIARLNPAPARAFDAAAEPLIPPDLIFAKIDGVWTARLNDEAFPKLRLSSEYKNLLGRERLSADDRAYLTGQIRDARATLACVAQRRATLEALGNALCRAQRDFFEKGPAFLKPLTMGDIAQDIGVHEATVSRAQADKYADTPWGFFPLRRFFTHGFSAGAGDASSAEAVKQRIAEWIRAEDPRAPLSDGAIAARLSADGVAVARRTVAKYREALGVPPVLQRKRLS